MREKKEPVLVFCDKEEEYAQLMTEFLRAHKELPLSVHTYTDTEALMCKERENTIDLMVVSERTYEERMASLHPGRMIILMEIGLGKFEDFVRVEKYQQAQNVLQSILEVYLESADDVFVHMTDLGETTFIGVYSPVRRCYQTTFALTLSQMLSEKRRTLYLNFEHFSGLAELAAREGARDLADLLYFLMAEKEKFAVRLKTIVQHQGSLDYVPPMKSGQNLLSVSGEEWKQLLHKLEESGLYDFVVMDLSESMQGLFEILRCCRLVYTLTKEDHIAQRKIEEYERILKAYAFEDILQKTRKRQVPKIRKIPEALDEYTKSEIADFVKRQIKELERENG